MTVAHLLSRRCRQLLGELPTTLDQDLLLLVGGGMSEELRMAVQYRAGKKQVLHAALGSFSG